jgi:TonB-like protein
MKIAGYVVLVICLFALPVVAQNEIGIPAYPNATEMPQATERLLEQKAPTWLAARAYRTNDPIKTVVKYFSERATKAPAPVANDIINRLLENNWKITDRKIEFSPTIFGVGEELRKSSTEDSKISFGVLVLNDSFVRVHLMSPHPSNADNNKVEQGTMIILVRERPADTTQTVDADADEPVYTGRDVTQRVRLISKPEPFYPGGRGLVVLKAVFSGSGKVTKIMIVQGVPGLTEEAIKAARKIEFYPAIKDGRPVAMWLQLEYRFF